MQFGEQELNVIETKDQKQWCMTIEEVARGYDVSKNTIMMHLKNHDDELRQGIEKGMSNIDTLGGRQQVTVIYREGVIKLGFFIRSKQAATFRQWATNLVVQHLDHHNTDIGQLLQEFKSEIKEEIAGVRMVCKGLRDDLDEVKAVLHIFMTETDEKEIRDLMKQVKNQTGMDGRKVVGHVRKSLNLATIYDTPNTRHVINALKNMLGTGIHLLN